MFVAIHFRFKFLGGYGDGNGVKFTDNADTFDEMLLHFACCIQNKLILTVTCTNREG